MKRALVTSLLLFTLAACGNEPAAKGKGDAVEVEPGTVSDSMIILDDTSVDGTAVDTSIPSDTSRKSPTKSATKASNTVTPSDVVTGGDTPSEAPPAAPAPAPEPAAKQGE